MEQDGEAFDLSRLSIAPSSIIKRTDDRLCLYTVPLGPKWVLPRGTSNVYEVDLRISKQRGELPKSGSSERVFFLLELARELLRSLVSGMGSLRSSAETEAELRGGKDGVKIWKETKTSRPRDRFSPLLSR